MSYPRPILIQTALKGEWYEAIHFIDKVFWNGRFYPLTKGVRIREL